MYRTCTASYFFILQLSKHRLQLYSEGQPSEFAPAARRAWEPTRGVRQATGELAVVPEVAGGRARTKRGTLAAAVAAVYTPGHCFRSPDLHRA